MEFFGACKLLRVVIREAQLRDVHVLSELDRNCFPSNWSETDFTLFFCDRENHALLVSYGEETMGFLLYRLDGMNVEILRVAVLPPYQRRGAASQMFARMMCNLGSTAQKRISVLVRESELSAQLFLRSMGFSATTILRKFFTDTSEDAYAMYYPQRARRKNGIHHSGFALQ